jgi:hypothetical protein
MAVYLGEGATMTVVGVENIPWLGLADEEGAEMAMTSLLKGHTDAVLAMDADIGDGGLEGPEEVHWLIDQVEYMSLEEYRERIGPERAAVEMMEEYEM